MICPNCGRAFSKNNKICPVCEIELVKSSADKSVSQSERWLPLRDLPGNIYAEMVKEVLDNKGIPCIIQSDATSAVLGIRTASSPGATAQIFVPQKYHETCKQIMLDMMDHI